MEISQKLDSEQPCRHVPQEVAIDIPCAPCLPQFLTPLPSRDRQVTDLDVTVLGFSGPGLPSARQMLCGDAPRFFFYHFSVHLSIVLGRTELCHEVWTPGPQKPQIINNENHHLALLEGPYTLCECFSGTQSTVARVRLQPVLLS